MSCTGGSAFTGFQAAFIPGYPKAGGSIRFSGNKPRPFSRLHPFSVEREAGQAARQIKNTTKDRMKTLSALFENNRQWASRISQADPLFFSRLSQQQNPDFLWIGCADSRVPANEIIGLLPGELFVHRNVANLVIHTDLNCLSVIQYAVDVLHISDIIVCGHYGCGGVRAALEDKPHGLIDAWLTPIRELLQRNSQELAHIETFEGKVHRLCELNVIDQVKRVGHTPFVQEAWRQKRPLNIHGWIYSISDGLLQDLNACISSAAELNALNDR